MEECTFSASLAYFLLNYARGNGKLLHFDCLRRHDKERKKKLIFLFAVSAVAVAGKLVSLKMIMSHPFLRCKRPTRLPNGTEGISASKCIEQNHIRLLMMMLPQLGKKCRKEDGVLDVSNERMNERTRLIL